jgi:glycosyltransferase involved in cell wall biosynthesis
VLRILFLNEGGHGSNVLGHVRAHSSFEAGLIEQPDVEAHHAVLPPMDRVARLATHFVPLLSPLDLDLGATRWHVAQSLRARRTLRSALRQFDPHAVHVTTHTVAFALEDEMKRRPTFLSLDATVAQWSAMGVWRRVRPYSDLVLAPSLALERRALTRAAAVLAWTPWAAKGAREAAPKANVVEQNPGLDLQRFRPAPHPPGTPPRILFVGGRFEEKGGYDLLAALEPLLAQDRVTLDLVTPAAVPAHRGVTVHSLSAADDALVALYQAADLFCLPTRGDTMGFSNLEAMACGTPVISTRVGGIPDVLANGGAGVLVEPSNIRELRSAIAALLGDEPRRRALGAAGRQRCEERYDAVKQADRLVRLIREVIDGRKGANVA